MEENAIYTKEAEATNVLIAEFMELDTYSNEGGGKIYIINDYDRRQSNSLDHHFSWEWLMPVIDRMESMGMEITIGGFDTHIRYSFFTGGTGIFNIPQTESLGYARVSESEGTRLERTYKAIVEFVTWYKDQTTPIEIDQTKKK